MFDDFVLLLYCTVFQSFLNLSPLNISASRPCAPGIPTLTSAGTMCQDAVVSVTYTLTWNESSITEVQVDIIAAEVPISDFRYSFICQGTSTRRQRRDLFGLRVKLLHITTSLTTQR